MNEDKGSEIKKSLIDELETLHSSLSAAPSDTTGSLAQNSLDENGIPILVDVIKLIGAQVAVDELDEDELDEDENEYPIKEPTGQLIGALDNTELSGEKNIPPHVSQPLSQMDLSLIPTLYPEDHKKEQQIDNLIDELVAEYLPIMERRIRTQLREQLSAKYKAH